jgi:hypothetical protein
MNFESDKERADYFYNAYKEQIEVVRTDRLKYENAWNELYNLTQVSDREIRRLERELRSLKSSIKTIAGVLGK